jgi:hypothetical protein
MRHADICAAYMQFGLGEFAPADAKFHDEDEKRDRAGLAFRKPIHKRAPINCYLSWTFGEVKDENFAPNNRNDVSRIAREMILKS